MGSKSRIAKDIVPIIQSCINSNGITRYYEPFCGGGNIIDKISCTEKIGNDKNEYLIDFWNAMQNGLDLKSIEMNKEIYADVKNNKDKYPKYMVAIAGVLAAYNSKWFAGYAKTHIAKAPSNKHEVVRNYYLESVNNVLAQMPNLSDVKFIAGDYDRSDIELHNAMIYCDPPYINTCGFKDKFNHEAYWEWIRNVSKNNFVLCSEYVAPDDFVEIWSGQVKISLDNASRSKVTEKLFTYRGGLYDQYRRSI